MTLKEWNDRPELRLAWKEFYKSPAGQGVKNVLTFLGTPVPTMAPQNVDFVAWNATVNARREGYYEAVRLLGALTEEPSPQEELPAPWEREKIETTEK